MILTVADRLGSLFVGVYKSVREIEDEIEILKVAHMTISIK